MNKSKVPISLLIILVLLSLAPIPVRAEKPVKKYRAHWVDPVPDGKWITQITIVSWETEDAGVYRVSAAFTLTWVGSEDMWTWRIHYKGTSKSWTSISQNYLITGKMENIVQYTVFGDPDGDDGYDGNYRIWFEDGYIVRQEGKGYLWLP